MPPRTDLKTQVAARLRELQPAYEEYLTLLDVQTTLQGLKSAPARGGRGGRRGPGRPPGSGRNSARRTTATRAAKGTRGRAAAANGRRRRRRAGGTRADQALKLIKSNPGITVPDIAKRMGIRQNYLYRVTAGLQKQGSVKRRGSGFQAA
jgi:hypothetical protein